MNFSPQLLQNAFFQNYLNKTILHSSSDTKEVFEDVSCFLSGAQLNDFIAFNDTVTKFNELLNIDPEDGLLPDEKHLQKIAHDFSLYAHQKDMPYRYRLKMLENLLFYVGKHMHNNQAYADILEKVSILTGPNDDSQRRYGKDLLFHRRGLDPIFYLAHMQKIYFRMQNKLDFEPIQLEQLGIFTTVKQQKNKQVMVIPAYKKWPPEKRNERLQKIETMLYKSDIFTSKERILLAEEAVELCSNNGRSRTMNFNSKAKLHELLRDEYCGKDIPKYKEHFREWNRWLNAIDSLERHTPYHPDDPNVR